MKQTQGCYVEQAQGSCVVDSVEEFEREEIDVMQTRVETEDVKLALGLEKVYQRCQKCKKVEKKQPQRVREPSEVALTCGQGIALGD